MLDANGAIDTEGLSHNEGLLPPDEEIGTVSEKNTQCTIEWCSRISICIHSELSSHINTVLQFLDR